MDVVNKIRTFVEFCYASAIMLEKDHELPTERLICLYQECMVMAKHCEDIDTMVDSCLDLVSHSNSIGRHADSLRCLKEILPSARGIPEYEVRVYLGLSLTYLELEEFDNVILHAKKCTEIARKIGYKESEIQGHTQMAQALISLGRYDDAIDCGKRCLVIARETDSRAHEIIAYDIMKIANQRMQKHDAIILYANKLLHCATKTNDQEAMVSAYLSLATAYVALEHYQDAADYGKKCIDIAREIEDRSSEGQAYLLMGQVNQGVADYDNAILYCKKCLELAIAIGDKQVEACAYSLLGGVYRSLGKHDDAIANCNKCLDIHKEGNEEKPVDASTYLILGRANQSLEKYDEAIQYYKQCIDIVNSIDGDKEIRVAACGGLGKIYEKLKQYDDAVHYYKKTMDMAQETEEKTMGAQACLRLLSLYQTLDEKDNAIQYGKKCIDLAQETGDKTMEAQACLRLLSLYVTLDEKDNAIQYGKKCIDLAQEIGDKTMEAQACLRLLSLYVTLDEKDNAIQYGKKCIDLAQETGDKETEMKGHYSLARIYLTSMQVDDVFLSIDAGMAIATELGDKECEEKFINILSDFYGIVGLHDKARKPPSTKESVSEVSSCSEEQLLEDFDQAVKTGSKCRKCWALTKLIEFYQLKQEYLKAISCLEQVINMNVSGTVNFSCFTNSGHFYRLIGQYDEALRCFRDGLPIAESCSDNIIRSRFYLGFGGLLHLLNRELDSAERYLREAIRCFEAMFTSLGTRDEFKISIFDNYIHSYKLLVSLLINDKRIDEALLVLDHCRARALNDLMITNYKMEQEGSNDEQLEISDVLSLVSRNDSSISFYSLCFEAFVKFFLRGETDTRYSLKFFVNAIQENDFLQPLVNILFDEMRVREVVNCENRSLDKEQDVQQEQTRCIEDHEDLDEAIASLLNLGTGKSNEDSEIETKGSTPAEALFDILGCDRILLSEQDEVVILPEGPLYQVPFAALRDPRTGKYLSETKRIRLAPSLAILKHYKDFPVDQTSNAKPLIIGDPLVGRVMINGEERYIQRLPGAREEAKKISELLDTPALLEGDATKPAVIKRLQEGVSVVHIAAHGILSKATIVLAPSPEVRATKPIPDEEDYMLTMADVQQAKVRAQLVVLGCCHSGRGEIRAEGVVGMCRAFLASGARAVVASLWAIEDKATLEFMVTFYGHLKAGNSASTSLQLTMNEMRFSTKYTEPKYWAPFFLMGDDVTLKL